MLHYLLIFPINNKKTISKLYCNNSVLKYLNQKLVEATNLVTKNMSASGPHKTRLNRQPAWLSGQAIIRCVPCFSFFPRPAPAPAVIVPPSYEKPWQPMRAQHGAGLTNERPSRCHQMGWISVRAAPAPAAVSARWEK